MGRCKDCKYFKRNTDKYLNKQFGRCMNETKLDYGSSYDNKSYSNTIITPDMLLYEDYERYSASLEVGEDFGCIHFENKEV